MIIHVTQADIDAANPDDASRNCVALAIKRVKKRDDVKAWVYVGQIRIGKRRFDLDDYAHNRLILHLNNHKIEPFEFELI